MKERTTKLVEGEAESTSLDEQVLWMVLDEQGEPIHIAGPRGRALYTEGSKKDSAIRSLLNTLRKVGKKKFTEEGGGARIVTVRLSEETVNFHKMLTTSHQHKAGLITVGSKKLEEHFRSFYDAATQLRESSRQIKDDGWDATLETFLSCPALDEDQIVLAKRHAEERRGLMENYTFLGADEFANLIPASITKKTNVFRTLGRWIKKNKVLAIKFSGDWKYPAIQVNPRSSDIYPELAQLIPKAAKQGYNHWEILSWLVSPAKTEIEAVPGRAIENLDKFPNPLDLIEQIEKTIPELPPEKAELPINLLSSGQTTLFYQVAHRWLREAL